MSDTMISLLAQSSLSPFLSWLLTVGVVILVVGGGILALFSLFFRKVGPEEAIVRSGVGGLKAKTGEGIFVIPFLHRAEVMDLSLKRIDIKLRGESGLICQDNVRANIEVSFYVRVNNKIQDILQVAEAVGCQRASDQAAVVALFDPLFSEALTTVALRFDFLQLYRERDKFKAAMLDVIGRDLNGYALVDCAIDYLEKTPGNSSAGPQGDAESGAQLAQNPPLDPQLQLLIEHWPTLSKDVQQQIMLLVG
ncbi:MAG TPA: hypothetical protein EYN70_00565 [Planctomycetaceae bacterium]|nr:hypothetical protein [Planctomycetaceae bacterium]